MPRRAPLAVAFGMALLLVGCGGGDDSGDGAAVTGGGEGTIAVSVGETDESTMYMNLSATTAPAGEVTFVITNEGQEEHEFEVFKTSAAASDFEVGSDDKAIDPEDAEELVEVEGIEPGATKTTTLDLEPGHYALICNEEGHYGDGMFADLEVT